MVTALQTQSELSRQKQESKHELIENVGKGKESMQETIQSVQNISLSVDGIASAIKIISSIAANTNLLAMNAAIEAAHAGDAGRGFAVVADEIRRLSETTRENSRNISQTLSNIIQGINVTSKRSNETNNLITIMSQEINSFANTITELINTLSELSAGSGKITSALKSVHEHSLAVKQGYVSMLAKTGKLKEDMDSLAGVAADKMAAH
jgi:methyl-accepting chemotaxis protein